MRVAPEKTSRADLRIKKLFEYEITKTEIDTGILDVVILLNRYGLMTTSSCEGGEGHGFKLPTVIIKDDGKVTHDMIAGVLIGAGYIAFTIQHNHYYQDTVQPWEYGQHNFTVEFWRLEEKKKT